MTRILIINRFYHPEMVGGAEIVVEKLADLIQKQGHTATILTWSETPGTVMVKGVRVVRLPRVRKKLPFMFDLGKWFAGFPQLWKEIKHADLIHIFNIHAIPNYAITLLMLHLQNKPVVHEVLDPYLFMLFDNSKLFFSKSVVLPFFKGIQYSCVSQYMKKQICARGIAPADTIIARPFIPLETHKTQYKKKKKHVLFVGQMVEHKGVHVLLKTVPLLKDKHPELRVTFVGKGDAEEEVKQLAHDLGVEKQVTFAGYLPRDKLQKYYDQNEFLVFPSLWEEPLGVTTFEALDQKLPVICFPTGGTIEIVKNGYNGIVVQEKTPEKLAAAMDTLLSNPRLIKKYAKNAKITTKELSFENEKRKVTALYQKMIRENRNRVKQN